MESTKAFSQSLSRVRRNPLWLRRCAALFGLSAVLWASPGWAQSSPAALAPTDFFLVLQAQDGDSWVDLSPADAATYLNQARCQCATPVQILVQMASASRSKLSGLTTTGTNARLYVGNTCANLNAAGTEPQCPERHARLSCQRHIDPVGKWKLGRGHYRGQALCCRRRLQFHFQHDDLALARFHRHRVSGLGRNRHQRAPPGHSTRRHGP
jgi:hypothetical protein